MALPARDNAAESVHSRARDTICRRRETVANRIFRLLIAPICIGLLAACGDTTSGHGSAEFYGGAAPASLAANRMAKRDDGDSYLAYEHTITVDVDEDRIEEIFTSLQNSCASDDEHDCTLLDSSISLGDYKSANLRVRIDPEGVDALVRQAEEAGDVTNRNTHIEDLSKTIVDLDRRIAMLTTYRERLQQLETRAADDVESLIRVTSELTNVQSQIEELTGQVDFQKQRVDMEIVNINLIVDHGESLWRPIGEAFAAFGRNLGEAVSQAVTAVAFLLPWSLLLLACAWIARRLWRWRRR